MTIKTKFSNVTKLSDSNKAVKPPVTIDAEASTPEFVQDYIVSMLGELSEMAHTSGLQHLSSLLQMSLLAVNGAQNVD